MKTLYDALLEQGLVTPDAPQEPVVESEPLETLTGKAFSEAVLRSEEFRMYIIEGLNERDLPPAVLCRLMDHGWGKPVEKLEVSERSTLENLTPELAVQKLERVERMLQLLRRAQVDDDVDSPSIH